MSVMRRRMLYPYQGAVYVSANGSDTLGNGRRGSPYQTIRRAYQACQDGDAIVLLTDITATEPFALDDGAADITLRGDTGTEKFVYAGAKNDELVTGNITHFRDMVLSQDGNGEIEIGGANVQIVDFLRVTVTQEPTSTLTNLGTLFINSGSGANNIQNDFTDCLFLARRGYCVYVRSKQPTANFTNCKVQSVGADTTAIMLGTSNIFTANINGLEIEGDPENESKIAFTHSYSGATYAHNVSGAGVIRNNNYSLFVISNWNFNGKLLEALDRSGKISIGGPIRGEITVMAGESGSQNPIITDGSVFAKSEGGYPITEEDLAAFICGVEGYTFALENNRIIYKAVTA